MARARGKVELSLFPFLNILFSLIGVLLLYIFVVLVMGRAGGRASVQAGLVRGRAEAREKDREAEALRKKRDDLAAAYERMSRELERLDAEREQLAQLLELRGRQDTMPPAGTGTRGVPIGAPVPKEWRMIPVDRESGDNRKKPTLIRVSAERFIAYDFDARGELSRKTEFPAIGTPAAGRNAPARPRGAGAGDRADGPGAAPAPDARLAAFLDGINNARRDRYVLFLISPDGIDQFLRVMRYCIARYPTLLSDPPPKGARAGDRFDFGFEPFSEDWLLIRRAADPRG